MFKVTLKHKKEASLLRGHRWVFSGAIYQVDEGAKEGDLVDVYSSKDEKLGTGHLGGGSIMVRMLAFGDVPVDQGFWDNRISDAWQLRSLMGLGPDQSTTCFRLINAEGDGLPGLIVDVYGSACVIQSHSFGMQNSIDSIAEALQKLEGLEFETIYHRPAHKGSPAFIKGEKTEDEVLENNMKLNVNWVDGQKTGFFLDQRDNRKLLGEISSGKSVLNTFCYTGGYSVAALLGGADKVVSVDSSALAIDLTDQNVGLNGDFSIKHEAVVSDTFDYLKNADQFDIVILDPPAFAKHKRSRHNAIQGYRRLNAAAMAKMKPGSLLMTYSCSQAVDATMFEKAVMAGALDAGVEPVVLKHLGHGADHPVSLFHPEGNYLKGLLLEIR